VTVAERLDPVIVPASVAVCHVAPPSCDCWMANPVIVLPPSLASVQFTVA